MRRGFILFTALGAFALAGSCAKGEELEPTGGKSGTAGTASEAGGQAGGGGSGGTGGGGTGATGGTGGTSTGGSGAVDASSDVSDDAPTDVTSEQPPIDAGKTDGCPGRLLTFGAGSSSSSLTETAGTQSNGDAGKGSCVIDSADVSDAVYRFLAPADGVMNVTLSAVFDSVLHVRSTCSIVTAEMYCKNDAGVNQPEELSFPVTQGREYFVFADGVTAAGPYTMHFVFVPNLPLELCPGEPLTLSGSGASDRTVATGGTLAERQSDYAGTCTPSSGQAKDAVYQITAAVDGILTASLAPSGFDGVVYIRSACTGTEEACGNAAGAGTTDIARARATKDASYWIFVDGADASNADTYTLNVTLSPTAADDRCDGQAVTLTSNAFSVDGNTSQRWDDYKGSCNSSSSAPDVVYSLTPTVNGDLTLTLTPDGWDGVLYVRSVCATTEMRCADDFGNATAESTTVSLDAGTKYFIIVDGKGTSAGAFNLRGSFVPAKDSERCPGQLLTLSGTPPRATVSADLAAHVPDYEPTECTTNPIKNPANKDAVYRVRPTSAGNLTVQLTPTGFDGGFFVRTNCTSASVTPICQDANGSNQIEITTVPVTAGQDYFIVVEGINGSAGQFRLDLSM